MKKLRGKAWLAVAFGALAALVFTGCPHNDILHSGGGADSGGKRSEAGGNVEVIVTNFVSKAPAANRSASWLAPQRSIAPEHVDLSLQTEIEKYVFVASGSGDGIYDPEFIDITPVTGVATLKGIPSDGYWNITVDAYDVAKLGMGNRGTILATPTNVTTVVGKKDDALVLSGSASVQLGGSAKQVVLTLTNDNAGTTGDVDVAIYFSNDNEAQTIFDGTNKYKVSVRLIDSVGTTVLASGGAGQGTSDVMLYDTDQRIDEEVPGGTYEYRKYNSENKNYSDIDVEAIGNQKLLSYKPKNPAQVGNPIQFPKGKYMLLVSVTDTATGDVYYAADPDFVVEGNRTTKGVLEINGILGTAPATPTGLEVYWKKPGVADILEGFDTTFKWGPSDMFAVGYEIEVADITSIYQEDVGGNTQIKSTAGFETFNDAENLWKNFLDNTAKISADDRAKYVTKLSWQVTPQTNLDIPRWLSGSLLAGNDHITVRLRTGSIYSVRVRAVNGTRRGSDWVYFGTVNNGTDVTNGGTFTKFVQAEANGIFDLVKVTYKLDNNDMYTLTQDRSADFKVNGDTQVTGAALLQVFEYDPATDEQLSYAFTGATVTAQTQDDQVLVVKGDPDKKIVRSWIGWQDQTTNTLFGPANTAAQPPVTTKAQWTYEGFKDLVLVPVGAGGGGSVNVEANTADTTNVLNLQTVGFGINTAPTINNHNTVLAQLTQFATRSPEGVYKNTAENKLVVVLGSNKAASTTSLYVSIGDYNGADKVEDTLTDKNGNSITVTDLKVELRRNGLQVIKQATGFTPANPTAAPAYAVFDNATGGKSKLGGMMSGEYTLFVQLTTGEGRTQSTQIPVVVLYADQAANQPAIP